MLTWRISVCWSLTLVHVHCSTVLLCPGFVQTDMGTKSALKLGMKEAPTTVPDCANQIVLLLDKATRDTHGGKFWDIMNDKELPW